MQTLAKKFFAVGSAVAMTMSLALPFAAHAAAHGAGTNVKSADGTIWMITANGTRRAYTSAGAFQSYGFNSFATVVDANADDLALPVDAAGFIAPQDGKIFCATATKGSDVKGECSLITGGMKSAFTSASVFTGLGFSFSRAQYGDSSFMTKTSDTNSTTAAHRAGVLVNNNGTVQLVGTTGLLGIPDLTTFNSWGYSFADVVPANAADKAMTQNGVMAARQPGQLSPSALAGGTSGGPVVSGNVTAMLASDNPAAGTVVAGQAIADLAHFTFSGTGTVTQVVVKRIGVSADATLSNVYLYNGNTKLTDAGSVSNGTVTFSNSNGLFTVNGSVTVSVKSDIATGTSGQTVGAQLASFTVANGSPVSTSIAGNTMTVATASLATVSVGTVTSVGSSVNAGTMNTSLWSSQLSVGTRNVALKYIAFKQIGSIQPSAVQNLKLYLNGNQIGSTASIDSNNNVAFDLTGSPATLQTGAQTLELRGDVVGGSNLNFSFRVQTVSDIVLVDSNYNVNVTATMGTGSFPATPGTTTVSAGTVSVQLDPNFTATQMVKNASNVTLGSWTMKAYGENVKVQSLKVVQTFTGAATTSVEGFNNLAIYVNGGMVGSSQAALGSGTTYTSATYTFGTTNLFTIPAGQTVTVTVKGDLTLNSNTLVTAVKTDLMTPSGSLQGVTSYQTSPSSDTTYTGTTLSVVSSSATLTKNSAYTVSSLGPNTTKQKLGSFVIQANNAEGVKVTSLTTALTAGSGNTANPTTTLANLYLVTPDFPNGTTPQAVSTSNNFAVNFTVPASQTATVDVYADVSNTSGTVTFQLNGSGLGASSNQTVTLTQQTGQQITIGAGTLNTPTLAAASPVDSFVIGGSTNQAAATFNFVAASGAVTITQLDFMATTTTSSIPVTSVTVAGQTVPMVAGSSPRATSTVTGLNISVPTNFSGVNVPVTMNLANVGNNGLSGNLPFTLNLTHVKYTSGGTTTDAYYNVASNSFILVGSAPTLSLASVDSGTLLTSGTQTVAKLTVTANAAGDVILRAIPLTFSSQGGASTTVASNNVVLIDSATGQTASTSNTSFGVTSGGSAANTTVTISGSLATIAAGTSRTYLIQVPITGTFSSSPAASFSTKLGAASSFTFKDVNSNTDNISVSQTNVLNGNSLTATYVPNYPSNSVSIHN